MPLVDYSSSSDSEPDLTADDNPGPAKKRKTDHQQPEADLPPLPSAFHDLYASTVRLSTRDDPSLHQGRKRQVPHVVGNWPSHVYIEWHPTPQEHTILTSLLKTLSSRLSSLTSDFSTFLTSDLGSPLPLHISLSRPLSLTTAQKDDFLAQLRGSLSTCGLTPFDLGFRGLEWHRSHESARSFLVLRVSQTRDAAAGKARHASRAQRGDDAENQGAEPGQQQQQQQQEKEENPKADGEPRQEDDVKKGGSTPTNPDLTALLRRCNALAASFSQPELYAPRSASDAAPPYAQADAASHLAVAWSFAPPTPRLRAITAEVATDQTGVARRLGEMRVAVDGVKVKIGNVVTQVPLPRARAAAGASRGEGGLFG